MIWIMRCSWLVGSLSAALLIMLGKYQAATAVASMGILVLLSRLLDDDKL